MKQKNKVVEPQLTHPYYYMGENEKRKGTDLAYGCLKTKNKILIHVICIEWRSGVNTLSYFKQQALKLQ